jgi:FkbM family methyltransferase
VKVLNKLIDAATVSRKLRALMRYASDRSEGLQYGSYQLADEVALAVSFLDTPSMRGGGVVIDAGANKGSWSFSLLASNPTIEKLIVIEPQSVHMASLQKLKDINPNVVIEQAAIGSTIGELTLYADSLGSTLASLYDRDLTHVGSKMARQGVVHVTTLDALAELHSLHSIAFLKLDLEGHELEALNGAKDLLGRKAIDAIAFEFGGCNIDSRTYIKDFWSLLVSKHQFSLYRVLPKQRLRRWTKYSESLEQFNWSNILACAPGVNPTWKILD